MPNYMSYNKDGSLAYHGPDISAAQRAKDQSPLTRRDLEFLKNRMSGELLNYLGHAMVGTKLNDKESAHLEYMRGLSDRLDAAIAAAP